MSQKSMQNPQSNRQYDLNQIQEQYFQSEFINKMQARVNHSVEHAEQ